MGNLTVSELQNEAFDLGYQTCLHDRYNFIWSAAEEFQAYKKTGLTPAEVAELAKIKADGLLVVLPCKRGDTVYFIKSAFSKVAFPIKAKVTSIRGIDCDGAVMYNAVTDYSNLDRRFTNDNIGKTVFLTEIEAQTELKRMENENGTKPNLL